jgi:aspartyl-tRNA(Asn)/glutamyl-tRNA(Gln) amidotransferase subunit A
MRTIAQTLAAFQSRTLLPTAVAEAGLARASDPAGEGARTFRVLDAALVRSQARAADAAVLAGEVGPLTGVSISVKDLFDVRGEITAAGSTVMRDGNVIATEDCPAVARLRAAGAVLFGRSNMVEFAFSGIGTNPHYGTPRCVWDRAVDGGVGRAPGGSSSGAGVSVADQFCIAALGTDTGGSVRIPAAFNGLVGFKPSAYRVPTQGVVPLSHTFDSIGPLAASVTCCAQLDAVLSAQTLHMPRVDRAQLRLLAPTNTVWTGLDPAVERASRAALDRLRRAGVTVVEQALPVLDDYFENLAKLLIVSPEALAWHRAHINASGIGYDPRVWQRMQLGANVPFADYVQALAWRRHWVERMHAAMQSFDAVVCPTVACVPPPLAPILRDDATYFTTNTRILRNTSWVNFADACALSIPCHAMGDAPVGLQLTAVHAGDARLLAIGDALEQVIRPAA